MPNQLNPRDAETLVSNTFQTFVAGLDLIFRPYGVSVRGLHYLSGQFQVLLSPSSAQTEAEDAPPPPNVISLDQIVEVRDVVRDSLTERKFPLCHERGVYVRPLRNFEGLEVVVRYRMGPEEVVENG